MAIDIVRNLRRNELTGDLESGYDPDAPIYRHGDAFSFTHSSIGTNSVIEKRFLGGNGGSALVTIASHSGSVVTNGLSENTYYPARTSGGVSPVIRLGVPQGLSGVVDFTVTIRSIINPSMSFSQNLLLTFNN